MNYSRYFSFITTHRSESRSVRAFIVISMRSVCLQIREWEKKKPEDDGITHRQKHIQTNKQTNIAAAVRSSIHKRHHHRRRRHRRRFRSRRWCSHMKPIDHWAHEHKNREMINWTGMQSCWCVCVCLYVDVRVRTASTSSLRYSRTYVFIFLFIHTVAFSRVSSFRIWLRLFFCFDVSDAFESDIDRSAVDLFSPAASVILCWIFRVRVLDI